MGQNQQNIGGSATKEWVCSLQAESYGTPGLSYV
jgi:hypothetical protein